MDPGERNRRTACLNDLIVLCNDDSRAYGDASHAAETVHAGDAYAAGLLALSQRRTGFADELAVVVREMGASPTRGGTFSGWVRHIGVAPDHLRDSLVACERAEARTIDGHRRVLEIGWPVDVLELLEAQLAELERDYLRFGTLHGPAGRPHTTTARMRRVGLVD